MKLSALLFALFITAAGPALADAQSVVVPEPADLRLEATEARNRNLPILVMFGSDDCPYCELLEREFLRPMIYSGHYENQILIRRLHMNQSLVTDFNGQPITGRELAERFDVKFTPTIVFLDAEGRQVANKMVGVTTPEFYGGYLDEAITTALNQVRAQALRADSTR